MKTWICLFAVLLGACSQDSDEACQSKRDCADGLICDIAPRADRGVCRKESLMMDVDESVEEAEPLPVDGDDAGSDVDGG